MLAARSEPYLLHERSQKHPRPWCVRTKYSKSSDAQFALLRARVGTIGIVRVAVRRSPALVATMLLLGRVFHRSAYVKGKEAEEKRDSAHIDRGKKKEERKKKDQKYTAIPPRAAQAAT